MEDEDWDVEVNSASTPSFKPMSFEPATVVVPPPARPFGLASIGRGRGTLFQRTGFNSSSNNSSSEPDRNTRPTLPIQSSHNSTSSHASMETEISSTANNRGFGSGSRPAYGGQDRYDNNNNFAKSSFSSQTEVISIETKSISAIIGKAGATINNIKDKCNVRVIIPPREEIQNQSHAEIKIVGQSKESIDRAIQMIQDKASESSYSSNSSYRPDHSRNRSNSAKRYHPYEDDKSRSSFGASSHDENKPKTGFCLSYNTASSSYSSKPAESQQPATIDWDMVRAQVNA